MVIGLPALATELDWRSFDTLPAGERALAEQTVMPIFGDDPEQWPDWIDPAALFVPSRSGFLMIVRRPQHLPCGQYGFTIFGPVTPDGRRDLYGDFCGGSVGIIPVEGRDWPDIEILEGREQIAEDQWRRLDQRLRYQNGQWWRILPN
jgi:hypothetical protein